MSQLPPLPDIFGNYTIRGIEEIVAPSPVSLLPSSPGWRYLAIVLLLLGLWWSWKWLQRWRRNRYRKTALIELSQLVEYHSFEESLLAPLAALLKATALQCRPRTEIAALRGEQWLDWLDRQCPRPLFSENSRYLLTQALYRRRSAVETAHISRLVMETKLWIQQHSELDHA